VLLHKKYRLLFSSVKFATHFFLYIFTSFCGSLHYPYNACNLLVVFPGAHVDPCCTDTSNASLPPCTPQSHVELFCICWLGLWRPFRPPRQVRKPAYAGSSQCRFRLISCPKANLFSLHLNDTDRQQVLIRKHNRCHSYLINNKYR